MEKKKTHKSLKQLKVAFNSRDLFFFYYKSVCLKFLNFKRKLLFKNKEFIFIKRLKNY